MGRQTAPRGEGWLALSGLLGAGLALPLSRCAHGPEFAAILAVSSIALLAGQRWAIAAVVLAELFLLPTVWPRALETGWISRLIALATLLAIMPGVRAVPRAAAALVSMIGRDRTDRLYRCTRIGFVAIGVFAAIMPLL
jgi:hypothetical protein